MFLAFWSASLSGQWKWAGGGGLKQLRGYPAHRARCAGRPLALRHLAFRFEGCETPAGGGDTGGLLYIEQFSRRPGVELGQFRSMVAAATGSWDPDEAADQMLLTAGRSWYVARSLALRARSPAR